MRTFKLDKLIRDEVFEDMEKIGQKVEYRILEDDTEFLRALKSKLEEEKLEAETEENDSGKEQGHLDAVIEQIDIVANPQNFTQQRAVGAFASRIFVTKLQLEDKDPWVDYYTRQPERFPEIIESIDVSQTWQD